MRIPVRALQDRELRLLVASRGVSTLGTAMAEVALAFAVLQIGSVTDLGLVLLAREIPTVIFLLLGGVWADRISRKMLLVWSDAVRARPRARLPCCCSRVWHRCGTWPRYRSSSGSWVPLLGLLTSASCSRR